MDYTKEYDEIKNVPETWKPSTGTYEVGLLGEPEKTVYEDRETGDKSDQLKIHIRTNSNEYVWYVPKGKTLRSAYGQLMALGKKYGILSGQIIHVNIVVHKKNGQERRSYNITEAIQAITEMEDRTESG